MKKLLLLSLCLATCMVSCQRNGSLPEDSTDYADTTCCCPHPVILLQPYDDFTQKEAESLAAEIKKHEDDFGGWGIREVKVLPTKQSTSALKNDTKTRLRADKILKELKGVSSDYNTTVVALTHKDISVTYRGRDDWGVIGLAFSGRRVAVVSTYRLRNQRDLWKATAHEFLHAFYNLGHCQWDNPHCILQDAKGKYVFGRSPHLCDSCKQML